MTTINHTRFNQVQFDAATSATYIELQKAYATLAQMIENSIPVQSEVKGLVFSKLEEASMWTNAALKDVQVFNQNPERSAA